jgi:hypothetical protein
MIDFEEFKKKIDEFCESEEGKAYFELEAKKQVLLENRFERFKDWLKTNNFDDLLNKLIARHDENYRTKCYNKGYEPMPNNVLYFIFDYINFNYDIIDVDQPKVDFPNNVWFFKGYYFQIIWGQGSINRIYDKDFKLILQI